MSNHQEELFDLISQLALHRPFRVNSLTQTLKISLQADSSNQNSFFILYRSAQHKDGPILQVELRESIGAPKQGPASGLLILEIDPQLNILEEEVRKRFGDHPELSRPTPHRSPETPLYQIYKQDWGKLSFGFSRKQPSCLVRVVFDAVKD